MLVLSLGDNTLRPSAVCFHWKSLLFFLSKEREHQLGGGWAEGQEQADSLLGAWQGADPGTLGSWPETKAYNQLSHPGTPTENHF